MIFEGLYCFVGQPTHHVNSLPLNNAIFVPDAACRFALTLKPQRADLVTLVKDLISSPLRWHALNTYNSATCFADLTGLNLWSGLTGDDVMELLEYCTERWGRLSLACERMSS